MAVKYFSGFQRSRARRTKAAPRRAAAQAIDTRNPDELIEKIRFLASAGRLTDSRRFGENERAVILKQMERNGASFKMLYDFSEAMKAGKHYEAISVMLGKASGYTDAGDKRIIFDAANNFIRAFGK